MRKRNILLLADTIFWYIIYFLPVILYGIYLIHGSESAELMSFYDWWNFSLFGTATAVNPIYSVLVNIFGTHGVLPLFTAGNSVNVIFYILTWFVGAYILHLAVDFLLFIPRLAHKWMDGFTKGKEC